MKTIVFTIMIFMFSSLGASTSILNSGKLSESYNNSNSKALQSLEKFEFKIDMADSFKKLNTKYQKNTSILHKVVVIVNYRF